MSDREGIDLGRSSPPDDADTVLRFLLRGAPVRGEIVSLDQAWTEVVSRHHLPQAVREKLGELSAAALLLAATIKFDGALVLQIHGDGPVALFVVECLTDGRYRATVKLQEDAGAIEARAALSDLVDVHGRGRFVVTLDPRSRTPGREPWQGIVPLDGGSVAQVLERYMLRSEQLDTRLWLAADERRAVGLLLQRMPQEGGKHEAAPKVGGNGSENFATDEHEIDEDGWNRMQMLAATITTGELLGLRPRTVLHRLFGREPLHAFEERPLRFGCNCSQEKVDGMLRLLGRAEVDGILRERGRVEVHCDFCNQGFTLDAAQCARLFAADAEQAPAPRTLH